MLRCEGQQHLLDAGSACSRAGMANVALDRTNEAVRLIGVTRQDPGDGFRLYGVSELRSCAVSFDIVEVGRPDPGLCPDLAEKIRLCAGRRRRHAMRAPILVAARGTQDTENGVAVSEGGL